MWPFKKTTGVERAARRYQLACKALRSNANTVHPYHVALHSIAWGLREVVDGPPNEARRTDLVAYVAFRQAMWYDCIIARAESALLRGLVYDALLTAGGVLYQEITGRKMPWGKQTKVLQQVLDAFPAVRAAPDGFKAFALLSTVCGYPPDPIIMMHLGTSYAGFQKYMASALAFFPLGDRDSILDRTGLIPFEEWLELIGVRDRQREDEDWELGDPLDF